MKIKNIFFAAILVLAGFSCSMEDDAIMNDVEKGIEEATEAYTVLDFGVAFNEMATKASTTVVPGEDRPATGDENNDEKKISLKYNWTTQNYNNCDGVQNMIVSMP